MTADATDVRQALGAALRRELRLEKAVRDAIDCLENQWPAHALEHLRRALMVEGR